MVKAHTKSMVPEVQLVAFGDGAVGAVGSGERATHVRGCGRGTCSRMISSGIARLPCASMFRSYVRDPSLAPGSESAMFV